MVIRNFRKNALIAGSAKPWYQTIWIEDGKVVVSLDFLNGSLFHISF